MQAKDLMTKSVVTATPDASVSEVAKILLKRRISAVPIVDAEGKIAGIISEGDLMRRSETGTERSTSWWLELVQSPREQALDYLKSHSQHAKDVMTRNVVTVTEETPAVEIAAMLEKRGIKRVPVTRDDKLVGIVGRADLIRGLATSKPIQPFSTDDQSLREAAQAAIKKRAGLHAIFVDVIVTKGVAHIWGGVELPATKDAIRVAVENVPGIKSIEDNINVFPAAVRSVFWTE